MSSRLFGTLAFFFLLVLLLALSKHTNIAGFRGGEGIGGRTAGPAASMLSPADIDGFEDEKAVKGREPASTLEGFADLAVQGKDEATGSGDSTLSPANASLNKPRKPYHLLSDVLQDAPRDTVGCLRAGCCDETDFESRTNLTGNYIQRTNNYKRVYPDNCTGPLHEFTMSFYKTEKL
jgi:hypothetical protein